MKQNVILAKYYLKIFNQKYKLQSVDDKTPTIFLDLQKGRLLHAEQSGCV